MIRAPSPDGMGEVTGRTPWVAKSDFWPGRPKDITPKIAHAALEKVAAGEPLRKAEQRFVDYANEWLDRQEAAPAPRERTVERRRDSSQRLRVAEMNPEEMRQALLTDELTGLGNRRAFQESSGRTWRAAVDADSLKFINDSFGHAAGDQMLARIGEAFRDEGVDAYHVSGDEFVALFDTEEEAYDVMGRVKARLAQVKITATGPDGDTITKTGVDFSYGLGQDNASAETGLQRDKAEREDSGLRAARGEEPPGVVRGPAVQAGEGRGGTAPAEVEPGPATPAKPTETPAKAGVSTSEPNEFASTQVRLSAADSERVMAAAQRIIDPEDRHEKGLEDRPHITVKYGIHSDDPANVRSTIETHGPIDAKVGGIEVFEPKDKDYDVLVLRVASDDLQAMNKAVAGATETTDTHPTYKPHITLGYVKRGTGAKYAEAKTGLEGRSLHFNEVEFSTRDEKMTAIPLVSKTPPLDLTGETEAEVRAREAAQAKAETAKRQRDAAPPPGDFTLIGSESPADQARARGQLELAPAAESAPAVADVPPGLLKRITVTVEQYHEGEGVKSVQVSADKALADVQDEIDAYETLLKCVKGAA
jgi:diguanylate cyclase (GGDEF)-like protein